MVEEAERIDLYARPEDVVRARVTGAAFGPAFPVAGTVTVAMLTVVIAAGLAAGQHSEAIAKRIIRMYGGSLLARWDES